MPDDAARVLTLPDPALVVLVGAAGAGKTTFAGRHFPPDAILGSDAFRALIAGDERDQGATRGAFGILHRAVVRRLAARQLTVVDATNVLPHARRALTARARAARVPAVAIVLDLPASVVIDRNAARIGRVVADDVVRRQLDDLRHSVAAGSLEADGFDAVHHLRTPAEVDGVRIVGLAPL
jgi:predicted kinase